MQDDHVTGSSEETLATSLGRGGSERDRRRMSTVSNWNEKADDGEGEKDGTRPSPAQTEEGATWRDEGRQTSTRTMVKAPPRHRHRQRHRAATIHEPWRFRIARPVFSPRGWRENRHSCALICHPPRLCLCPRRRDGEFEVVDLSFVAALKGGTGHGAPRFRAFAGGTWSCSLSSVLSLSSLSRVPPCLVLSGTSRVVFVPPHRAPAARPARPPAW